MNGEEFEKRMRGGEAFAPITVLDGMYVVVRVDGRRAASSRAFWRMSRTGSMGWWTRASGLRTLS